MIRKHFADEVHAERGHAAAETEELFVVEAGCWWASSGRLGVRQHLEDEQREADTGALDGGKRLLAASCWDGEAEHRPLGAVVVDGGEG